MCRLTVVQQLSKSKTFFFPLQAFQILLKRVTKSASLRYWSPLTNKKAVDPHRVSAISRCTKYALWISDQPTAAAAADAYGKSVSVQIIEDSALLPPGTPSYDTIETELNWNMSEVCWGIFSQR